MVILDRAELRKMRPDQRITKLRELSDDLHEEIEARQKEIKDARKLIEESVNEMERNRFADKFPIPEQKILNIDELFTNEPVDTEQPKPLTDLEKVEQLHYQMQQDYQFVKEIAYGDHSHDEHQLEDVERRLDEVKGLQLSKEIADMLVATRGTLEKMRKYQRT